MVDDEKDPFEEVQEECEDHEWNSKFNRVDGNGYGNGKNGNGNDGNSLQVRRISGQYMVYIYDQSYKQ